MQNKHYIHLLYVLTLLSATLLWRTPYVALACLIATSTLLLQATRWKYTRIYIFCAIAGSISEIIAIAAGAWHYGNPQFMGIPVWLPLAWGSASILFMQISQPSATKSKKYAAHRKTQKSAPRRA